MLVMGVDPGSRSTGYGLIESDGNRHRVVSYGAIRSQPQKPFPSRLLKVYEGLKTIINCYQPKALALEEVFYAANVKSLLALGQVRGVILIVAAQVDLPVYEYSVLEIKKAVVGYGRADKQQVQKMMQIMLGLRKAPEPTDASDALAVAICHLHSSGKTSIARGFDPRRGLDNQARIRGPE